MFCIFALCLFFYGLFAAGIIIDKLGVKNSLTIGIWLYFLAKFVLIFAEYRWQIYLCLCTIAPLGLAILFPVLLLGAKKLTKPNVRTQAFSFLQGAMILGAVLAGPIVDLLRLSKTTSLEYTHTNTITGEDETRIEDFSSWRTI